MWKKMKKVLITTVPFAKTNNLSLDMLEKANLSYSMNPLHRKLTSEELKEMISEYDDLRH